MKYFNVEFLLESDQIGSYFPQIQWPSADYDKEGETSYLKIKSGHIPSFIPNLRSFDLGPDTRLTDVLSNHTLPRGLVVSDRLMVLLSNRFNLPRHEFYPIALKQRGIRINNYYWLLISCNYTELIDYEKSIFYVESFGDFLEYVYPGNSSELLQYIGSSVNKCNTIQAKEITLLPEFDKFGIDLFYLNSTVNPFQISERLVDVLNSNRITGVEFSESVIRQ